MPSSKQIKRRSLPMRWLGWASALSIIIFVQTAYASSGCSTCAGNDVRSYRSYRGPACFAPPGYCLAPGCCICPPSACDNAWDGYCEEKAKWQAYFTLVGTPRAHYYGGGAIGSSESCNNSQEHQADVEAQPTPAAKSTIPPAPSPPVMTPKKSTWNMTIPWFR